MAPGLDDPPQNREVPIAIHRFPIKWAERMINLWERDWEIYRFIYLERERVRERAMDPYPVIVEWVAIVIEVLFPYIDL